MAFEAGAHTYQVSPAAKSFALSKNDSFIGITKVVFTVEGDAPVAGPEVIELNPDDTGKKWILAEMPANDIELQVEYYAESYLFLSKDALADKTSIAVTAGDLGVQFGEDGKSANPVTEGTAMTVKYNGAKKIIGMKAEKKKAAVMTTVTWNSTNVFNSAHEDVELSKWSPTPLTYEGITISLSATKASSFQAYDEDDHIGSLLCYGNNGDSFTFTAPSGKKFCKIEIINNGFIVFTNYGDWTRDADNKIVWSGTAATAVTLGSVYTDADNLNSIVFYLSE